MVVQEVVYVEKRPDILDENIGRGVGGEVEEIGYRRVWVGVKRLGMRHAVKERGVNLSPEEVIGASNLVKEGAFWDKVADSAGGFPDAHPFPIDENLAEIEGGRGELAL